MGFVTLHTGKTPMFRLSLISRSPLTCRRGATLLELILGGLLGAGILAVGVVVVLVILNLAKAL